MPALKSPSNKILAEMVEDVEVVWSFTVKENPDLNIFELTCFNVGLVASTFVSGVVHRVRWSLEVKHQLAPT